MISTGAYPYFRAMYLTIPKAGAKDLIPTQKFLGFALSQDGQKIIKDCGTVTLEDGKSLWAPYRRKMIEAGITVGDF